MSNCSLLYASPIKGGKIQTTVGTPGCIPQGLSKALSGAHSVNIELGLHLPKHHLLEAGQIDPQVVYQNSPPSVCVHPLEWLDVLKVETNPWTFEACFCWNPLHLWKPRLRSEQSLSGTQHLRCKGWRILPGSGEVWKRFTIYTKKPKLMNSQTHKTNASAWQGTGIFSTGVSPWISPSQNHPRTWWPWGGRGSSWPLGLSSFDFRELQSKKVPTTS